mmetsp:Transcript_30322/g.50185  ORF Transcript_30322/g.50185 Transcript_30322/m.50185 type:complete len:215 (+) Transcript_30322:458-1102(+)
MLAPFAAARRCWGRRCRGRCGRCPRGRCRCIGRGRRLSVWVITGRRRVSRIGGSSLLRVGVVARVPPVGRRRLAVAPGRRGASVLASLQGLGTVGHHILHQLHRIVHSVRVRPRDTDLAGVHVLVDLHPGVGHALQVPDHLPAPADDPADGEGVALHFLRDPGLPRGRPHLGRPVLHHVPHQRLRLGAGLGRARHHHLSWQSLWHILINLNVCS